MPFAFHYAARSDVGMVRSNNEDSGYAGPHLLAMADGMGGHAGGDVASSTVIGALVRLDGEALGGRDVSSALLERIKHANTEIGDQAHADPDLEGMGTTLIALLRAGDKIVLAHIGDSRAFMVRGGVVTQITKDHSFVQNLVDEGRITPEEAQSHPQRSLVTRVLTGAHEDEPDLVVRQGRIGDRYLIASDGLTDYVARDTISQVLTDTVDPAQTADRLVALALRAGAPDNVTVVVGDLVDIGSAPPTQPQVVGAAAVRETGTRPMPTTPAAKAAALTAQATGGADPDDGVTLAEEGPRSRRGTVLRVAAIALVLLVVAAGSSYAGYAWSQRQYYLAEQDGVVAVFRGVEQNLGPISLSRPEFATTIAIDDLPASYQDSLEQGIEVDDRAAAEVRVAELQLQATACRWAQLNGEVCRTVPATWTAPTPTPTPSPTASPTASPTPTASSSPTPAPNAPFSPRTTPTIAPTVEPTVPPDAVATGGPVTS
jgi:PPM family protein phosphatase